MIHGWVWKVGWVLAMALFGRVAVIAKTPASCSGAEYREFDFWAGNWDVFEQGNKVAQARVDRILDGCVLHEDYQQADGHHGESFTIYDAARGTWHQSWVTNRGERLEIEGRMEHGSIVMSGEDPSGKLVRGTWTSAGDGVREVAVTSSDHGKNWTPWFDLMFRPAQGTDGEADDQATVANLDRRYQEAVKKNDAATMDQILADDFTLVIGSGKVFRKADLLEEARTGRYQYELQDDSDQSVRVWGDTTVITAKLKAVGTESGKTFDYELWFSDVYRKTRDGWKYVFGQASLPLRKQ